MGYSPWGLKELNMTERLHFRESGSEKSLVFENDFFAHKIGSRDGLEKVYYLLQAPPFIRQSSGQQRLPQLS